MQLWGTSRDGKARFYCPRCRISSVRKRADVTERSKQKILAQWLTGTHTQKEVAQTHHISDRTIRSITKKPFEHIPFCVCPVAILDGVWIGEDTCVLIARSTEHVLGWIFARREDRYGYERLTQHIYAPVFVLDGKPGVVGVIEQHHPLVRIQRCLVHVERQVRSCISSKPKTHYGIELSKLVKQLFSIRTKRQKKRWVRAYRRWRKKSYPFLLERTQQKARWWYTHKTLRRARKHIDNALDSLFTFITYYQAPRTTNHLEGGINSRLKELLHRHRGLSDTRKCLLVSLFLSEKLSKNQH